MIEINNFVMNWNRNKVVQFNLFYYNIYSWSVWMYYIEKNTNKLAQHYRFNRSYLEDDAFKCIIELDYPSLMEWEVMSI